MLDSDRLLDSHRLLDSERLRDSPCLLDSDRLLPDRVEEHVDHLRLRISPSSFSRSSSRLPRDSTA